MGKFAETQEGISAALAAMSQDLRNLGIGLTGLRNVVENNVIAQETRKFPVGGVIERNWQQRFAAVNVRNLSAANPVTVSNMPTETGGVNTGMEGSGKWIVPAGQKDTINMAGETLTLYGTAGDFVCIQVFTRPRNP